MLNFKERSYFTVKVLTLRLFSKINLKTTHTVHTRAISQSLDWRETNVILCANKQTLCCHILNIYFFVSHSFVTSILPSIHCLPSNKLFWCHIRKVLSYQFKNWCTDVHCTDLLTSKVYIKNGHHSGVALCNPKIKNWPILLQTLHIFFL